MRMNQTLLFAEGSLGSVKTGSRNGRLETTAMMNSSMWMIGCLANKKANVQ